RSGSADLESHTTDPGSSIGATRAAPGGRRPRLPQSGPQAGARPIDPAPYAAVTLPPSCRPAPPHPLPPGPGRRVPPSGHERPSAVGPVPRPPPRGTLFAKVRCRTVRSSPARTNVRAPDGSRTAQVTFRRRESALGGRSLYLRLPGCTSHSLSALAEPPLRPARSFGARLPLRPVGPDGRGTTVRRAVRREPGS